MARDNSQEQIDESDFNEIAYCSPPLRHVEEEEIGTVEQELDSFEQIVGVIREAQPRHLEIGLGTVETWIKRIRKAAAQC